VSKRTILVLVIALIIGAACGVGRPGGEPGDPGSGAGPGTSEQQPDADEFEGDVRGAVTVAERYWRQQFSYTGARFTPIRQVIAYERDGQVRCGRAPLTRNNAAYCPAGDFIAYDVNWAAAAFRQIGDAFLFFLLGHEYAHGIQVRLGIQYQFTIEQELQADCLAGAYIGDSIRDKQLQLEDGDLEELRAGLIAVGDDPGQPWFAPGAHGDAEARTKAFFAGYQGSIKECGLA